MLAHKLVQPFHVIDDASFTSQFSQARTLFMPRIHTHYDNLKVTRNAPPEVIRAAYKTLCQKFHPDRNPDNESARRTFLLIRTAYETLSDPEKRRLHDAWIASMEANEPMEPVALRPEKKPERPPHPTGQQRPRHRTKFVWQLCFWLVIGSLIFFGFFFN
nr:J domain-containing protein [uncultured Noviherbaspirillum sp.]